MTNKDYYKDDPLALHKAWRARKKKEVSFANFLKLEHKEPPADGDNAWMAVALDEMQLQIERILSLLVEYEARKDKKADDIAEIKSEIAAIRNETTIIKEEILVIEDTLTGAERKS